MIYHVPAYEFEGEYAILDLEKISEKEACLVDAFSYDILNMLRQRFRETTGSKPLAISAEGKEISGKQFCIKNWDDNFRVPMTEKYKSMFQKAFGESFLVKTRSIRSSAVMTYNLLEKGPVTIVHPQEKEEIEDICELDAEEELRRPKGVCNPLRRILGEGSYEVSYEKEVPIGNKKFCEKPSYLDAWLYNEEHGEVIACEMKMTEWLFNKPRTIKKEYLMPEYYTYAEAGAVFTEIFRKLAVWDPKEMPKPSKSIRSFIRNVLSNERKAYLEIPCECVFKRYEAMEMVRHALGCYNAVKAGDIELKKLSLVNVIWTMPYDVTIPDNTNERYCWREWTIFKEYDYMKKLMNPVHELFASIGVEFHIELCTVEQFMDMMEMTEDKKKYMERYL